MTRMASSEIHTSWINDKSSGQSDPIYLSFFIGHLSSRVRGGPGAPRSEREVVQDTFAATLSLQYPLPFAPRPLCPFAPLTYVESFGTLGTRIHASVSRNPSSRDRKS